MLRRILKSGAVQMLLLAGILMLCLAKLPEAYDIYFAEARVQQGESSDQVVLNVTGANLYRPNSFYIDGIRIEGAVIERIDYQECRVIVDKAAFGDKEGWRRLELGFSKWGVVSFLSNPIWIEWKT